MATRFIASKPTGNIPPSEGSNVLDLRVLGGRGLYHFRLELQDRSEKPLEPKILKQRHGSSAKVGKTKGHCRTGRNISPGGLRFRGGKTYL